MTNNIAPEKGVLECILPRLIQRSSVEPAVLGLEVLDGPYKGVVFGFTKFDVRQERLANGMVPTRFETTVYEAPENFAKDEGFDEFTSEVLLAWLNYIAVTDVQGFLKVAPLGAGTH